MWTSIRPVIDVMLVLLIIAHHHDPDPDAPVKLNMPVGLSTAADGPSRVVTIDVDFDGTVIWNGPDSAGSSSARGTVARCRRQPVQPELHLRPEQAGQVRECGDGDGSAQRLGMKKIGLIGNEQFIH